MPCLHSIASKVSALKTQGWGLTQRLESPGDLVTHMLGVCFLSVGNSAGLSDTTRICGLSMWSFQVGSLNFLTAWQHLEKNQEEVASLFVTYYQRSSSIASVIISPLKFKEKEHWFLLLMREFGSKSPCEKSVWDRWWRCRYFVTHGLPQMANGWDSHQGIFAVTCSTHSTMFNFFFFMFNIF